MLARLPLYLSTSIVFFALGHQPTMGGYIDFDPVGGGVQDASWPRPSTITVYIPEELFEPDQALNRTNLEAGILAAIDCLLGLTIEFKDGDPPAGATGVVDINIGDVPGPDFGMTVPSAFFRPGEEHGTISGATITIEEQALGFAGDNYLKNMGAHEMGHVLGLDDDPRTQGERIHFMDPNWTPDDAFLSGSEDEDTLLNQHYSICPEPSSLTLCVFGAFGLLGFAHRRVRMLPGGR